MPPAVREAGKRNAEGLSAKLTEGVRRAMRARVLRKIFLITRDKKRTPFRKSSQTVDKKGTFGIRKYPFTIISSFSSRQRSPFLSFHVASFFKFMDANKRVS